MHILISFAFFSSAGFFLPTPPREPVIGRWVGGKMRNFTFMLCLIGFTGCGDASFRGSGGLFGGEESGKKPSAPASFEPIRDSSDVEKNVPNQPCIDRKEGETGVIDFEKNPNGPASLRNSIITNDYTQSQGVTFSVDGNHEAIVRHVVRRNESQLPQEEEAWMCILCQGSPSRNRAIDAQAEAQIGRQVLSSTAAAAKEDGALRVDYVYPVSELSFDLIDVDGREVWVVQATDRDGSDIPGLSVDVSATGYRLDRTGNGAPTRVVIKSATNTAEIYGFYITGQKDSNLSFGFAFDNFDTGIPSCN